MQAARAVHRLCYRNYGNIVIIIIIIRESMSVQPVVTVADQRAGWTGTDWQFVRYESDGARPCVPGDGGRHDAHACLRHTVVPLGEAGDTYTNARDTNEIRLPGPLSL